MDVEQLIAFERIVREGSFSRAAWSLHIAQPTISARIHALEQEVGGPLFVRSSRRLSLTARGSSFLPYVRRALAVLHEGVEAARLTEAGQRGRITVGSLGSLMFGLVAPALADFQRAHPEVEYYVRSDDHLELVKLLSDGVIELGLIAWPCIDPLVAAMTPLLHLHEPVVLVVHAGHPLAGRNDVTQADVVGCNELFLLLRWWQSTHPTVARLAAQAQRAADVPMETGRYLVQDGMGIGFFTRTFIAEDLVRGRVVEVPVGDMPPLFRDSALVRLARDSPLSTASAEFVACVRARAVQAGLLNRNQMTR